MARSCAAHPVGPLAGGSSLRKHPGRLSFVMQSSVGARRTSRPQPASETEDAFGQPQCAWLIFQGIRNKEGMSDG